MEKKNIFWIWSHLPYPIPNTRVDKSQVFFHRKLTGVWNHRFWTYPMFFLMKSPLNWLPNPYLALLKLHFSWKFPSSVGQIPWKSPLLLFEPFFGLVQITTLPRKIAIFAARWCPPVRFVALSPHLIICVSWLMTLLLQPSYVHQRTLRNWGPEALGPHRNGNRAAELPRPRALL